MGARFAKNLKKLLRMRLNFADPLHTLMDVPHYYLGYHGENDVAAVKDISKVIRQSASKEVDYTAPSLLSNPAGPPVPASKKEGKIRVGFVSLYFKSHASSKMMKGIMKRLDRKRFEVHVFSLRDPGKPFDEDGDPIAASIKKNCDSYTVVPKYSLEQMRHAVEAKQLHALVFAEIGMDPGNYLLAHSRLAPVQIATHGHVYTTGVSTIDWYVTYDMFECKAGHQLCKGDAQEHYSERLALMNGLNYYSEPDQPKSVTPRARLLDNQGKPLPDDAILYIVPQTLYKITPEFDAVYKNILLKSPTARLVLKELKGELGKIIMARLKKTMPEVLDRIIMMPALDDDDFLSLYRVADVMLDPYPFGGYTTTFEGFSAGMPTVTLPHSMMMGRCTLGMYERLGVTDLIAKDKDDYVNLAVKLGEDAAMRADIKQRILDKKHVLFNQKDAVKSWGAFLEQTVRKTVSADCSDKTKPACVFG